MSQLSKWSRSVHTHCLAKQTGITPQEAIALFGNPPSSCSAAALLHSCMKVGWFRREEWHEEGRSANVRRSRYFAIDKEAMPSKRASTAHSYFHGLKRVRSVFELAGTL